MDSNKAAAKDAAPSAEGRTKLEWQVLCVMT